MNPSDFSTLVSIAFGAGGTAGALAVFVLQTWFKSRFETTQQRRLAEFKHDLDNSMELAKYQFQRRIADLNRYSERRHESYAELWKLLRTAHGRILDLQREAAPDFSYYDASDVEQHLAKKNIPSGKRAEVIAKWSQDRNLGVEELGSTLSSASRHEALAAFVDANNSYVANELYLSDQVIELAQQSLRELDSLRFYFHDVNDAPSVEGVAARRAAYETLQKLKSRIRDELSRGEHRIITHD